MREQAEAIFEEIKPEIFIIDEIHQTIIPTISLNLIQDKFNKNKTETCHSNTVQSQSPRVKQSSQRNSPITFRGATAKVQMNSKREGKPEDS